MDEKLLPVGEETKQTLPGVPSAKAQSWGAVISIVVIVMMIVVGAFYAWGQRVAQNIEYPVDNTGS
ncbi:MAG: hypothetical protein AAB442_00935 [Patescibacteria group bacterium]